MNKVAVYLQAGKKQIENKVLQLNKHIEKANRDDILAIEPDSTWESTYKFQPVLIKGNWIHIEYTDESKRRTKDKYKIDDPDANWNLNWILRSLKKGYKAEGKTL